MSQSDARTSPPKVRLTFRVGVIGHRPNRLPKDQRTLDELHGVVTAILDEAKIAVTAFQQDKHHASFYLDTTPVMRAISPLAEGADRLVAEEALNLGYELCCPMPFFQTEFEGDFDVASVIDFRTLLARAGEETGLVRFELDGRRNTKTEPDNEAKAYAAAGQVVLNQSDLLIVIWDGGASAGVGGTRDTLVKALHYHVPTIWVDALQPWLWRYLASEEELESLKRDGRYALNEADVGKPEMQRTRIAEVVRHIVDSELGLPAAQGHTRGHEKRRPPTLSGVNEYFRERKPALNLAVVWKMFRDLVNLGWPVVPAISVPNFVEQIRHDWPVGEDDFPAGSRNPPRMAPPSSLAIWVNSRLRGHYAWSDKLADLYADAYRSTYVLSYLFSVLAVFIALLPLAMKLEGDADRFCIAAELAVLSSVLILVGWALVRHWHDRWTDYRLLAELVRQLRFLVPLGGGRPFPHVQEHLALYGDPTLSWMYWHMRGITRDTNLPNAVVTQDYIRDCLEHMAAVVGTEQTGQWGFHETTRTRSEHIHQRLEWIAIGIFFLTLMGIGFHLYLASPTSLFHAWAPLADHWLVLVSATFPALSAALAGINNQGEFKRLAKRSTAMVDGLARLSNRIQDLQGAQAPLRSESVLRLSGQITEIMVQEVVDWRVMFVDRPQPTA